MTDTSRSVDWPLLPLESWQGTLDTLHMWMQIVGKTRLALAPMQNHWWQVALYVTARGLTTSAMPYGHRTLEIEFDFLSDSLEIRVSDGSGRAVRLEPQSVAQFYSTYMDALSSLGIDLHIMPVPVEVETAIPFREDDVHKSYDAQSARRFWMILRQADRVLKEFRGKFLGKSSPVHFFWGAFDLASTRFTGRTAPVHSWGPPNCPDYVMIEAYSHECASWGFWPGGGAVAEPAFYAYAYPEPAGYAERAITPSAASYVPELGEFILPYESVRTAADPDGMLREFLSSTYDAVATCGQWDRSALDRAE